MALALEDALIAIQSRRKALRHCLSFSDGRPDFLPHGGPAGSVVHRGVQAGNAEFAAEVVPRVLARQSPQIAGRLADMDVSQERVRGLPHWADLALITAT